MPSKLITAPSTTPVDLATAKLQAKVDGSVEDTLLTAMLQAATDLVQDYIQRQLMQATWELQLTHWCTDADGYIKLPNAPLVKVESVKYDNSANQEQTLSASEYQVDTTAEPGRIRFTGTLPSVYDKPNAIRIRYVAGYGPDGASEAAQQAAIPARAKIGILRAFTDFYEHRQDQTSATVYKLPMSIEYFLNPLRLFL